MQFRGEQSRSARTRLSVELLLGARPLQAVDRPSIYDLVQGLGEAFAVIHADIRHAAVVGRGQVRADYVVGAFSPRVLDHVRIGGHRGAALGEAAVGGVLLVLESGFLVGAGFFAFSALFQADYHADGYEDDEGHEGGDGSDYHHVFGGEVGFGGDSSARRGAG